MFKKVGRYFSVPEWMSRHYRDSDAKMSKTTRRKSSSGSTSKSTNINNNNIEDDKEKVQECLNTLRELLKGETKLKVRTDEKFLLRYLRWVDFDPEQAFRKIKEKYKLMAENKDWFCSKPPSEFESLLDLNIHVMLDERDSLGRRVYLVKLANIDMNRVTVHDMAQLDDLWLEIAMDEEETQKNGLAVIIDMGGYSWKMLRWLTPHNNKLGSQKHNTLSLKKIDIHIVNTSFLLDTAISLVYPFLEDRVKEYIHFHSQDWPSLHEFINPEILPVEYGGQVPSLDYKKLRNYLYRNSDNLMEQFAMGYAET